MLGKHNKKRDRITSISINLVFVFNGKKLSASEWEGEQETHNKWVERKKYGNTRAERLHCFGNLPQEMDGCLLPFCLKH